MQSRAQHPKTADHPAIETGELLAIAGMLITPQDVRHFIEGIN